jgi:hypothetical protein
MSELKRGEKTLAKNSRNHKKREKKGEKKGRKKGTMNDPIGPKGPTYTLKDVLNFCITHEHQNWRQTGVELLAELVLFQQASLELILNF